MEGSGVTNGEAYVRFSEMPLRQLVKEAKQPGYGHDEEMARAELRARLTWRHSAKSVTRGA